MKQLRIALLATIVLAVAPGRAVRCTKRNGAVLVAFRYRLP